MLDFGWLELFLIIAVAVIVIGPNEIPVLMVALGRIIRRLQYVKFAISQQFEDIMRDADLDDIRKSVNFEENHRHNKERDQRRDQELGASIKDADFDEAESEEIAEEEGRHG